MPFENLLKTIPTPEIRAKMREILSWIQREYPRLTPVIKWSQPMFVLDQTFIIAFSAAKHHLNIAPEKKTLDLFKDPIKQAGYHQTTMLIQVKKHQTIDYPLLKAIIDYNIEDKKGMKTFWRHD